MKPLKCLFGRHFWVPLSKDNDGLVETLTCIRCPANTSKLTTKGKVLMEYKDIFEEVAALAELLGGSNANSKEN